MSAYRAHHSTRPAWTFTQILSLLGVLCTSTASAQFQSLAPTGDGSRLYFSSERRQTATDQPFHPKIFEISSTGAIRLAAVKPFAPMGFAGYSVVPYRYTAVSVSSDATVQSLTLSRDCWGGACLRTGPWSNFLRNGAEQPEVGGTCVLSRSGRFAACSGQSYNGAWNSPWGRFHDLETGASRYTAERVTINARPADNGTVCLSDGTLQDIEGRAIPVDLPASAACLDVDASAHVLAVRSAGQVLLFDTRTSRTLALGTETEVPGVQLSAAGLVAVYAARGVLSAWFAQTAQVRRYETAWPVNAAAIASEAPVAWATTVDGRILRIELTTGSVQDLTGPTPVITPPATLPIGSAVTFRAVEGSVLTGLRPRLGGAPTELPEIARSATELTVQIPWETPTGVAPSLVTETAPTSAFDSAFAWPITTTRTGAAFLKPAYHGDWRGPVTPNDPARPGEYIYLYAIGLGPVDQPVATGQPAPSNPPARVRDFICYPPWKPMNLNTWAGLAPGLIGYYQVSLQMPAEPQPSNPAGETGFGCTLGTFDVLLMKP